MANYAEVENGIVFNVCDWNGTDEFNPGDGITLVLIPNGSPAWIGWGYTVSGGFTAPPIGTSTGS
jgi:hypothetical protein